MNDAIPIHERSDMSEPCVSATKLRAIDERGEVWDEWCYKHHHWLNGAPAKTATDSLIESCSACWRSAG